jgi:glycosyltransferase involved in cell wall biosynthesis
MCPPTIAIDARYVRERPSGIGAMVEALVRDVPARMPDVSFLLLRHPLGPSPLSTAPNVREVTVSFEANGPKTLFMLPSRVNLSGVDLFHAPFNTLPAGLPMRTLVTIHDIMWLTNPSLCGAEGLWGHVQSWFYRNGIQRAIRSADHIIAISQATRNEVITHHPKAASRCTTIPHGVDPKFTPSYDPSNDETIRVAQQRHAPGARQHVLIVGRAAPYKNQGNAVLAFLDAFPDSPDTHLVVVQRLGHEGASFQRLARQRGARDRVHVVPPMPERDLIALYRGALCLCHPSIQEGWGMPIAEAMACGCPVITSHCSAMPEVAGSAALFVEPSSVPNIAQALRTLAGDSMLRSRMIQKGLLRTRELSWNHTADQTAQIYRQLLEPRSAAA